MDILVVYGGKYVSVKECANEICRKLKGNVKLLNIDDLPRDKNYDQYDMIIIGGAVYVGSISKKLKTFCKNYHQLLLNKRVGLFLCTALDEETHLYFKKNFSEELLNHSIINETFGATVKAESTKFTDKLFNKMAAKAIGISHPENFQLNKANIDHFIQTINSVN